MRFLIVWELIIIIVAVLQVEVVALLERELHFYGRGCSVCSRHDLTDMDCRQDSHVHEGDLFTFTFVHLADAFYP